MAISSKESLVICQNSQGVEIRASLLRLTRYLAVLEIYNPHLVLQLSEVLDELKIIVGDRTAYCGRGIVSGLVNTGAVIVCEAKLDEGSFLLAPSAEGNGQCALRQDFGEFLSEWQRVYKVLPDFKVVVADMQTFLADLRLWLEQVELGIRSAPSGDRLDMERRTAEELGNSIVAAFDSMHERLESLSETIPEELRPAHQSFSKRQLHPLVMCSPFAYRTYHKPLGYAGDYEMVNMIVRDPYAGASLYAKVVNLWFLSQWPARAHRNRIEFLRNLLVRESLRGARRGRPIRVLNLGCGPAREIQEFLAEEAVCDYADFTLLDFNDETILHAQRTLGELKQRYHRRTPVQLQRKSVHQLLKEGARPSTGGSEKLYDLIYCAGLFDYLPDRTCKQLLTSFYNSLAPGGLLTATNVDTGRPFRHMLEFVLDWHLIYRDQKRMSSLLPDGVIDSEIRLERDSTEVNLFIQVRKPEHV